jgi:hypothetical protein
MAQGFLALNKDRKVLISSDTKNLFYNKMATYNGVISTSTLGGPSIRLSYLVTTSKQPIPFFTYPYGGGISASVTAGFTKTAKTTSYYSGSGKTRRLVTTTTYTLTISLNSISGLVVGQIIKFSSGNATVTADTNYFIRSISGLNITISTSRSNTVISNVVTSAYVNTTLNATVSNDPIFLSTTRVTNISGTQWEIELLASTTDVSVVPVVYIFTEYESTMERKGSYGMLVKSNDNGVSYDTRLNPLAILATRDVIPPTNPYGRADSTIVSALSAVLSDQTISSPPGLSNGELKPDNSLNYLVSSTLPASPVYFYMSIAQTYKRFQTYKNRSYSYGYILYSNQVTLHYYAYYQTFCRTGIAPSINSNSLYVSVGWTVVDTALGGPTEGTGELGYTRDTSDGYLLKGNSGNTFADDGYFFGYNAQSSNLSTIGTWVAPQTINVKNQTIIVADISRNI